MNGTLIGQVNAEISPHKHAIHVCNSTSTLVGRSRDGHDKTGSPSLIFTALQQEIADCKSSISVLAL